jgi:regulator of protease activity HflC (stomatin/prohibitin superfamily)
MKAFLILLLLAAIVAPIAAWISSKDKKYKTMSIKTLLMCIPLLCIILCIKIINAKEVGIVIEPSGINSTPIYTGWHFVAPWNKVFIMDRTVWVYTCSEHNKERNENEGDAIWVPTIDGIKMGFSVSVSWRIDPANAPWIFQNINDNDNNGNVIKGKYNWLQENVIRTKLKSAIAMAANKFTPIECYSNKREEIRNVALEIMKKEVATYKLIIDQIDLRETYYNKDYEAAINAKKLAEQEVLRLIEVTRQKEEQLKQASIDKDIVIQQAEGEAKALQIKGQAIASNPKIVELEWINKWNGKLPEYMMGNGQGIMLNLNNK